MVRALIAEIRGADISFFSSIIWSKCWRGRWPQTGVGDIKHQGMTQGHRPYNKAGAERNTVANTSLPTTERLLGYTLPDSEPRTILRIFWEGLSWNLICTRPACTYHRAVYLTHPEVLCLQKAGCRVLDNKGIKTLPWSFSFSADFVFFSFNSFFSSFLPFGLN